jgi:microtubule-associated protein-like 1/2
MIAGDDAGALRTYSVSIEGEYYMSSEFEAHPKGVGGILVLGDGTVVTGGDKDRKLKTWDSARDFDKRVDIKLPDGTGSIRSLSKQTIDQVSPILMNFEKGFGTKYFQIRNSHHAFVILI